MTRKGDAHGSNARTHGKQRAVSTSLEAADCLSAGAMDWPHRDPFDQLLAATAFAAAFCGILAAGAAVALLAPSSTPASLMMMLEDSGAKVFLLDGETGRALKESGHEPQVRRVALDDGEAGEAFSQWIGPDGAKPTDVSILPDQTFNIIYSSGTTGAPKGIVQPHRMRWTQFSRAVSLQPTR